MPPATHLRAHDANKAPLGLLPAHVELVMQLQHNDVGLLRCRYPDTGLNADALLQDVVYLTVMDRGTDLPHWFLLDDSSGDYSTPTGARQTALVARGTMSLLETAIVYPAQHDGSEPVDGLDPKHEFADATPGDVFLTLINKAKARGALPDLAMSFTATHDSAGVPWPTTRSVSYAAGTNYLTILRAACDNSWCDARMDGFTLELFVPDTVCAVDRPDVIIRTAQQVSKAPWKRSNRGIISHLLGVGKESNLVEVSDAQTAVTLGRREGHFSDGRMVTGGALTAAAQAELDRHTSAKEGFTLGIYTEAPPGETWAVPEVDFNVGDYIRWDHRRDSPTELEPLRVRTISYAWGGPNSPRSCELELNDVFVEQAISLARRVQGITNGAVNDAPLPVEKDVTVPGPTGSPNSTPTLYAKDNRHRVVVHVDWPAPTVNLDGSPYTDHGSYVVAYSTDGGGLGDTWTMTPAVAEPETWIDDLTPGGSFTPRVAARDVSGHQGPWVFGQTITLPVDDTPPAVPSTITLTSRLATVTLAWDGLDEVGAVMGWDFDHVEVAVGLSPAPSLLTATLTGKGSVTLTGYALGDVVFARARSVDTGGNASAWSPDTQVTVIGVEGPDIEANSVTTNHLEVGSVTASKIGLGAVGPDKVTFGVDNLAPNPAWSDEALRSTFPPPTGWSYSTDPTLLQDGQTHILQIGAGTESMPVTDPFIAAPGEKLYLRFEAAREAAADWAPSLNLGVVDSVGDPIATPPVTGDVNATAGVFTPYESVIEVPVGGLTVAPTFTAAAGTGGSWHVSKVSIRRVLASTNAAGQSLLIAPNGITLRGVNDDGAPSIEISTNGAEVITLRDPVTDEPLTVMDNAGNVSARAVAAADDITLAGVSLTDMLAALPQGALSKTKLAATINNLPSSNHPVVSSDFVLPGTGDRQIRLTFGIKAVAGATYPMAYHIKFSATSTAAITNSTHTIADGEVNATTQWHTYVYEFNSAELGVDPTGSRFLSALICARTSTAGGTSGTVSIIGGSAQQDGTYLLVEDLGPAIPTGRQTQGSSGESVGLATRTSAETTRKWSATYRGDGSYYDFATDKAYQGYHLASNGVLKSAIGAPDGMFTDLSGATVEWIRVYLLAEHWYYSSGGTAVLGVHASSTQPATFPGITGAVSHNFARGEPRWITLPSAWYDSFKSGAYRGITLHANNSTSPQHYGYFSAAATKWQWKYTK